MVHRQALAPLELSGSSTEHVDDVLKEKFHQVFDRHHGKVDLKALAPLLKQYSSIDITYAALHLPLDFRLVVYERLPGIDARVVFLVNTDRETRRALFAHLKEGALRWVFERMPVDEAVWVLEDMPHEKLRALVRVLAPEKARQIKDLQQRDRKSVARLMSSEFFVFQMENTIAEAADVIREKSRIDLNRGMFVVDAQEELKGYIPARHMITYPSDVFLHKIMQPVTHIVRADASREEVIDMFERYKLTNLPVIDENNRFVGVVNQEAIVEAMEEAAGETMAYLSGTNECVTSHDPIWRRVRTRFPWLIFTLFAGLGNVFVMSSFERKEGGLLMFALFFVPLITGMSGNIGLQCSTILIRLMAMGGFSKGSRRETVIKELLSGCITGVLFGVGCGLIIYLFSGISPAGWGPLNPVAVAVIIGLGLIGSCMAGTVLGVVAPVLFARIGVDPAVSAGPIVTSFNDFLSMTIYFLIAWGVGCFFF